MTNIFFSLFSNISNNISFSLFNILGYIQNDAPETWQIGFQDSASPGFTGIIELHNNIFFFMTMISLSVF